MPDSNGYLKCDECGDHVPKIERVLCEECAGKAPLVKDPNAPTLRDRFAMAALTGFTANEGIDMHHEDMAAMVYLAADAMLAARDAKRED